MIVSLLFCVKICCNNDKTSSKWTVRSKTHLFDSPRYIHGITMHVVETFLTYFTICHVLMLFDILSDQLMFCGF